jgi:hypothetical protein
MKFSDGHTTPSIPLTAERATFERHISILWLTGHSPTTVPANSSRGQDTLMDRLSRLDSDTSWAVTQVEVTDDGHAIVWVIREKNRISVSDGSFKSKHGTASWVGEAASSDNRWKGNNITTGAPSDQSAYCSEVSGLLGMFWTFQTRQNSSRMDMHIQRNMIVFSMFYKM